MVLHTQLLRLFLYEYKVFLQPFFHLLIILLYNSTNSDSVIKSFLLIFFSLHIKKKSYLFIPKLSAIILASYFCSFGTVFLGLLFLGVSFLFSAFISSFLFVIFSTN